MLQDLIAAAGPMLRPQPDSTSDRLAQIGSWPGCSVVGLGNGEAVLARGPRIFAVDASGVSSAERQLGQLPQSPLRLDWWLAGVRRGAEQAGWHAAALASDTLYNAARAGIHHFAALPSGTRVATANGWLYRLTGRQFAAVFRFPGFRKPARAGVLADDRGRLWVAQYSLNDDRSQPVQLYRSDDDAQTFRAVHTFAAGAVRHLHFVQQDPHDGSIWLGTGDRDQEAALWRSADGDTSFERVGGGSQFWRATSLAFTDDAVVWGTDAGSDAPAVANVAVAMRRGSSSLAFERALQGPVHGATALPGGRVLLASGCEGGANEDDAAVHLWLREPSGVWSEIASYGAGLQPYRLQYAVGYFAAGQRDCETIWMQMRGTATLPLGVRVLRLQPPAE